MCSHGKELTTLKGHKKRHFSALFISGYGEWSQRPKAKSMASFFPSSTKQ
jgi:hypothetical protein